MGESTKWWKLSFTLERIAWMSQMTMPHTSSLRFTEVSELHKCCHPPSVTDIFYQSIWVTCYSFPQWVCSNQYSGTEWGPRVWWSDRVPTEKVKKASRMSVKMYCFWVKVNYLVVSVHSYKKKAFARLSSAYQAPGVVLILPIKTGHICNIICVWSHYPVRFPKIHLFSLMLPTSAEVKTMGVNRDMNEINYNMFLDP